MKLTVNLSSLWNKVHEMGASESEFSLDAQYREEIDIDGELERGFEVNLDDIESSNGLLSIQGRQVLLYIPDQGHKINDVFQEPSIGKKFHVADCKTLHDMRAKKRFERYKVTNNLKRSFDVYGVDPFTKNEVSGEAELAVCRNCLSFLNYHDYRYSASSDRTLTVKTFKFDEFFSTYNSVFSRLPKSNLFHTGSGYTDDWKNVSETYRKNHNYICEECGVQLSTSPALLHTHHISGNKKDNRDVNLQALCVDCHKKQPLHEHMFVAYKDINQINKLRKEQGLLTANTWPDVLRLSDTSLSGLITVLQKNNVSLPVLNYPMTDNRGQVTALLDLAWPNDKFGVVITASDYNKTSESDWNVAIPRLLYGFESGVFINVLRRFCDLFFNQQHQNYVKRF